MLGTKIEIIVASFSMGLTGGITHCIAMCHPFVLLISNRYASPGSQYSLLIPQIKYNLGRTLTYAILGAAAGAFGNLSAHIVTYQKSLLGLAGMLLIIIALLEFSGRRLRIPHIIKIEKIDPAGSPFLMGMVLGLLPCGMILGALINAAVSTDILTGALAMAAFGVGTSFGLILVALFGGFLLKYIKYTCWLFLAVFILTGARFIYKGLF